jgi:hypothetical protein
MSEVPTAVEIGDAVIFQKLRDEIVILNMSNQQYYGLNNVGAEMWQLLVENRDTEAVLERLRLNYAADGETLRKDLASLVTDLIAAGLLKKVN